MNRVKGSSIKNIPQFVKNEFGNSGHDKWINSLPDDIKLIYESDILASEWYPLNAYFEGDKTVCELFYKKDYTKASKIGKFVAEKNLTGLYKFFIKIGTPIFFIKRARAVASTFFENIKIEAEIINEKNIKLIILEFNDVEEIFDYHFLGWITRAMEITGCNNVKAQINSSLAKGDDKTEFEINWK